MGEKRSVGGRARCRTRCKVQSESSQLFKVARARLLGGPGSRRRMRWMHRSTCPMRCFVKLQCLSYHPPSSAGTASSSSSLQLASPALGSLLVAAMMSDHPRELPRPLWRFDDHHGRSATTTCFPSQRCSLPSPALTSSSASSAAAHFFSPSTVSALETIKVPRSLASIVFPLLVNGSVMSSPLNPRPDLMRRGRRRKRRRRRRMRNSGPLPWRRRTRASELRAQLLYRRDRRLKKPHRHPRVNGSINKSPAGLHSAALRTRLRCCSSSRVQGRLLHREGGLLWTVQCIVGTFERIAQADLAACFLHDVQCLHFLRTSFRFIVSPVRK